MATGRDLEVEAEEVLSLLQMSASVSPRIYFEVLPFLRKA